MSRMALFLVMTVAPAKVAAIFYAFLEVII